MPRSGHIILWCSSLLIVATAPALADMDAALAERLREAHAVYDAGRQAAIVRVNDALGVEYQALHQRYAAQERLYRQQLALLDRIHDPVRKHRKQAQLRAQYHTPGFRHYVDARIMLEHALERDHALQARCLTLYEHILDAVIDADPLLRHFFRSAAYREQHGLLLTRVVWQLAAGESASTVPLNAYSVFADRTQLPFLIRLSPEAFQSLPLVRSLLIHELSHVVFDKTPRFAQQLRATPPEDSRPTHAASHWYSFWFNVRHGGTPRYQARLLHEYYALRAQLHYDDVSSTADAAQRLSPQDRRQVEQLCQWALSELNAAHRAFIRRHPDPPLAFYVQRIYAAAAPVPSARRVRHDRESLASPVRTDAGGRP